MSTLSSHQLLRLSIVLLVAGIGACDSDKSTGVSGASALTPDAGVNAQTGTVGRPLAVPIAVHVTDANGNALVGVQVAWVALNGGSVDSASSTTNANGDAITGWTLGTVAGVDSLQAASNGIATLITATADAGPIAALTKVSGDAQTVSAGSATQPLIVEVVDQYGNPIAGATVTWSVSGGGSLSAMTSSSDSNGLAQVSLTTDPTAASYIVTASAGSATPVTFTANAN